MVRARTFSHDQACKLKLVTLVVLWVLTSVLAPVSASASGMRYENAGSYLDDGIYYLDAFARIEIGEEPERALMNGVELHFLVELVVYKTRKWWIDTPVLERRLRYKLHFYELTRHYRVDDLQTGASSNYRSLSAALRFLGQINRYALIEAKKINSSRRYKASIRVELDSTRLPATLAARAMVSREWNLQSEVLQWSLN